MNISETFPPSIFKKCHEFTRADEVRAKGVYPYFRAIEDSDGPIVQMEGRKIIMAGSNNYLGLTAHPQVKEAAIRAIEKYGTSCSGSRYLTGTIDLHNELEARLAQYMGKEAALLFSTGYQTGQGVINTLVSKGDYIFSDKDNHASIVAGSYLSSGMGANVLRFRHNDIAHLERLISNVPFEANKLIVSDGVFSTFGGIAHVRELNAVAKRHNAALLLDDAHALGVIGDGGRGTASYAGLDNEVDLIMTTFSKTLASLGGFVVGSERVINYLKHHSSALIFSASPTPASVAAALAALTILEKEPERVDKLAYNAQKVRSALQAMGYQTPNGATAIVPVLLGNDTAAFEMWRKLYDAGIFVNAFIPPATPPNQSMMRVSFMATHEDEHLDAIIDAFQRIGKELGIIG